MPRSPARRSAKEIIDEALQDNRTWEWLCFVLVILFAGTGIATVILGVLNGNELKVIVGAIVTGFLLPTLWFAARFRQENIRVRLLELPLSMVESPEQALEILKELRARTPREKPTTSQGEKR